MINAIDAVNLVGKMNKIGDLNDSAAPTTQSNAATGISFEQILSQIAGNVGSSLSKAEAVSTQRIAGHDVSLSGAVNSVMEAERALNTAIAIRDKLVQAYTEISRMQI